MMTPGWHERFGLTISARTRPKTPARGQDEIRAFPSADVFFSPGSKKPGSQKASCGAESGRPPFNRRRQPDPALRDRHHSATNPSARVLSPPCSLINLPEFLPHFTNHRAQLPPLGDCFPCVTPVLKCVAVAARRAGALCAAVHATSRLTAGCRCLAWAARGNPCATSGLIGRRRRS